MAIYALTIAAVAKSIKAGTLRISETLNGQNSMSFDVDSISGTVYRPAMGAEVYYAEDATFLFGGLVDVPAERGFAPHGGSRLTNSVDVVDFDALLDRRFVTETIPAGNLKDHLEVLETYLTPYGVTLDVAQVSGPAVAAREHRLRKLRECFDELSDLTGYIREISYGKVLRMYEPGTVPAPFNVVPASDPTVVVGDITVEAVRNEYANRVIVLAGTGIREITETFIGDGSTTVFPLAVPVAGSITLGETGTYKTVGIHGVDTEYEWVYRASDNAIVQLSPAPAGTTNAALSGAEWITVIYPGQHPFTKQADDAGEQASQGLWEKVIEAPTVWEPDVAQALADNYLTRYTASTFKRVQYQTSRSGIRPGQTQTITVPDRDLSGTFLITDVETVDTTAHTFLRTVTAVGGTVVPSSWRDLYRQWGSSSGGSPTPVVTSGGGGVGPVLGSPAYLGGSRNTAIAKSPAAWTPVVDYVTFTAPSSFGGRVRAQAWARNGSVSATVRLYDVTAATVVATSSAVTSTTAADVPLFAVGITAGHTYRLEVLSGTNAEGVFAIGVLESA